MPSSGNMELNKLNYDRERQVVDFVIRRNLADAAIVISGEVPVVMLSQGDIRGFAKAAVRQALLDAADALAGPEAQSRDDAAVEEGTRPEDLNASNDD